MPEDKNNEVLDTLTAREGEVLEQRFGLKDGYSRTLEEVGRQVAGDGVRREGVVLPGEVQAARAAAVEGEAVLHLDTESPKRIFSFNILDKDTRTLSPTS